MLNYQIPTLLCDFYKLSHREQYPTGTEVVYSTWTPRSNKYHPSTKEVVCFGAQAFIKEYLIDFFNENFFLVDIDNILKDYTRVLKYSLSINNPDVEHIKELHELKYLPLEIKAMPEGSSVPLRCPMLTIKNTDKRFFWLTNFLETIFSCEMWQASTSATIAKEYRHILDHYAEETGDPSFVQFQGHDFSMRGMGSLGSAIKSGMGHLLSFVGTDTVPAIIAMEQFYNADIERELVGTSIPATEHSVMCAGGDGESEFETYKRLINEVYPSGLVSIVSDTWDLWGCIRDIITSLKDDILARDGKVVIRPDSGDPVEIICGISTKHLGPKDGKIVDIRKSNSINVTVEEEQGLIEVLWSVFGGTINEKGYKVLDPHIGVIYGDSITLERCEEICKRLKAKGFASTNMVYGIGSYTYQYNTRDTFGFAFKSTMVVINGKETPIYKNPKTDDGTKKSNKGVVAVIDSGDGTIHCIDELSFNNKAPDLMRVIFRDGVLVVDDSLSEIRERCH